MIYKSLHIKTKDWTTYKHEPHKKNRVNSLNMCAYFNFVKQMLNIDVLILRNNRFAFDGQISCCHHFPSIFVHLLTIIKFHLHFSIFLRKQWLGDHMEPTLTRILMVLNFVCDFCLDQKFYMAVGDYYHFWLNEIDWEPQV